MDKLLQEQLEEFEKICPVKCEVFRGKEKIVCDFTEYLPVFKQFLTDFYYKIKEDQQKNKIIAIEKKMLEDKDFPIDQLLKKQIEEIKKWAESQKVWGIEKSEAERERKRLLNSLIKFLEDLKK